VDGSDHVAGAIAEVRPDVIVTFGPEGMTGHADHRAVSRWVSAAWHRSGSGAELWHATLTSGFHRRWGSLADAVGLWAEQPEPPSVPAHRLRHLVQLDGPRLDAKVAALRAHGSQTAGLESLVGAATYREWWSAEAFVTAPGHPARARRDRAVSVA
jgi:LmbE family N-acetylglucosaminyl deacetylase